jgi:hypothetical protein
VEPKKAALKKVELKKALRKIRKLSFLA